MIEELLLLDIVFGSDNIKIKSVYANNVKWKWILVPMSFVVYGLMG
jgi:hypothetical protein